MKAYVHIDVDPGSDVEKIVETIRHSSGVKEVCRVVGNADILATVEGSSLKNLSDITLQGISVIRGVSLGQTLICIDPEVLPRPTAAPSNGSEQIPTIAFS